MIPKNVSDFTYFSEQDNLQQCVDEEQACTGKHHKANNFVATTSVTE